MADWSNSDHEKAVRAAQDGVATDHQRRMLSQAAQQAGTRGDEATRALQGRR